MSESETQVIVCVCKSVSEREIRAVIRQGSSSVREVGRRCHAGTDCGMCRADIRELLRERGICESPTVTLSK